MIAEVFDGRFNVKRPDLFAGLVAAFPHDDLLKRHQADLP